MGLQACLRSSHVDLSHTSIGNVGLAVVRSCLQRGHAVTAFLRTPSKLPEEVKSHSNIRIAQGNALLKDDLGNAMPGK